MTEKKGFQKWASFVVENWLKMLLTSLTLAFLAVVGAAIIQVPWQWWFLVAPSFAVIGIVGCAYVVQLIDWYKGAIDRQALSTEIDVLREEGKALKESVQQLTAEVQRLRIQVDNEHVERARAALREHAKFHRGITSESEMRAWMLSGRYLAKETLVKSIASKFEAKFPPETERPINSRQKAVLRQAAVSLRAIATRLRPEHLKQ